MKSEEELKKARGRLTEAEMATIRSLKGTLEMFEKDPSITMIKMREMQNFYNTVRVLKDGYIETGLIGLPNSSSSSGYI
jgi:hypothetical protein